MAALLAARGFTCTTTMIEGPKGFAASFGTNASLQAALEKLGESFEISAFAYKPYTCGFVIHPSIDARLDIARTGTFDHTQIERIELTVNPLAVQLTSRPNPATRNQLLVSLEHWAAVSLIYEAAGLAQVSDALVNDPEVSNLRRKVVLNSTESVGREVAIARVVLKNGRSLEARILHCRGSIGCPMTDDEISEKTLGQLEIAFGAGLSERISRNVSAAGTIPGWTRYVRSLPLRDVLCRANRHSGLMPALFTTFAHLTASARM